MNQLTLILPFGIPPSALAKDLARQLAMPALAHLLSLSTSSMTAFEEFARLLPHERLLAEQKWLKGSVEQAQSNVNERLNSPANTHNAMQKLGVLPNEGDWFTLNPVNIHIAHNHLVLTDQRRLQISEAESRILFNEAKNICDELGKTLVYGDAKNWFLRADDWQELKTASLDAASGHNMDIWIAEGAHSKAWRKLQNEIQMQWHISPINAQREERGDALINSVWLHSGSQHVNENAITTTSELPNFSQELKNQIILLDQLSEAAINSDWNTWFSQMQSLENTYFAPLLQALKQGQIDQIQLFATDANRIIEFKIQSTAAWQFWKKFTNKPSLLPLFDVK